jgi:hypothetical protein
MANRDQNIIVTSRDIVVLRLQHMLILGLLNPQNIKFMNRLPRVVRDKEFRYVDQIHLCFLQPSSSRFTSMHFLREVHFHFLKSVTA